MANPITGPLSKNRDDIARVTTVNPISDSRDAVDVIAHTFFEVISSDVVEASSTVKIINATSHLAKQGDVIRLTSGTYNTFQGVVLSTTTDTITLAQEVEGEPSAADTFDILRFRAPTIGSSGGILVDLATDGPYLVFLDETTTTNITYVGKALPGTATSAASWQLFVLDETSGDLEVKYADGDALFDNVYDDRASDSYS